MSIYSNNKENISNKLETLKVAKSERNWLRNLILVKSPILIDEKLKESTH